MTPDAGLTKRYAEASGDPNPIHIDEDFAKKVGLPGCILHGLYSMAQVAKAHTDVAGGDPRALKRLEVQFRGMGFPEQEIVVSSTVTEADGGRIVTETVAAPGRQPHHPQRRRPSSSSNPLAATPAPRRRGYPVGTPDRRRARSGRSTPPGSAVSGA